MTCTYIFLSFCMCRCDAEQIVATAAHNHPNVPSDEDKIHPSDIFFFVHHIFDDAAALFSSLHTRN